MRTSLALGLAVLLGVHPVMAAPFRSDSTPTQTDTSTNRPQGFGEEQNRRLFGPGATSPRFAADSPLPKDDYRLGIGDALALHVTSPEGDFSYELTVTPQGDLFIPRIGQIPVMGRTVQQAEDRVNARIADREARGHLTLTAPRQIKVFATGQLEAPGVYTVGAETRLTEIIREAGGLSPNGSVRRVQITSGKGDKKTCDLYRFVFSGDLSHNPKLEAGDRVEIPLITSRVALTGQVARPGIYELTAEDKLTDLLRMAGGPTAEAGLAGATIWRGGLQQEKTPPEPLNLSQGTDKINLKNGDVLFIPHRYTAEEENVVFVYGEVARPGAVPYRLGAKLSDYLIAAGGPTQEADLGGVRWTGRNPSKLQVVNAHQILSDGRRDLDPQPQPGDVIFVPESFFVIRNFAEMSGLILGGATLLGLMVTLFLPPRQ